MLLHFAGNSAEQGGAMYIAFGGVKVVEGTYWQNEAWAGGVVMHKYVDPLRANGAEAIYANVAFLGNVVTGYGGVFCNEDASVITVYNGVFSGNRAEPPADYQYTPSSKGGAIVNFEQSKVTLLQSTMVNNRSTEGGAIYMSSGAISIFNSIIQGNHSDVTGTENFDPIGDYSSLVLEYNLLDQAVPDRANDKGGNKIGMALFANALGRDGVAGTLDDDLRQLPDSPGIDAGNSALLHADYLDLDNDGDVTEVLPLDLDRKERIDRMHEVSRIVDLGPYELNASFPVSNEDVAPIDESVCPEGPLTAAYPNPFANSTRLTFCATASGPAQVFLYDLLGRQQSVVFDRTVTAHQSYPIVVDRGGLAAGTYFLRVRQRGLTATRSVVLTP